MKSASFGSVRFSGKANFTFTKFESQAYFSGAIFAGDADFACNFAGPATFDSAKFHSKASFGAFFQKGINFTSADFFQDAAFVMATFDGEAEFCSVTFRRNVDFSESTFKGITRFWNMTVTGTVDWRAASFESRVSFLESRFEPANPNAPSAVFAFARFKVPGEVTFDRVDLSKALFHDCDVSDVHFLSSVSWGRRGRRSGIIFDEKIILDEGFAQRLKNQHGRRDFFKVAQTYRQLKKNYDNRLNYWVADDFHFGEMEMKRLDVPQSGRARRLRQWWHRVLGFVALYRWASDYGNNFHKPLIWMSVVVLFSVFLFPFAGLQRSSAGVVETYVSVAKAERSGGTIITREIELLGRAALASVDVAMFQKGTEYTPAYPWGRLLAIVESLLTSTLFALFLLALRRQFRR
jgi:uncharacterized protein YjbI with pentapeptide repeats